jgi:hypothetical protein
MSTVTIVGGQVVVFDTTDTTYSTIRNFNSASELPLGLAIESNILFPSGPNPVGSGFDYTNYDRGGLVSVFTDGGLFELWDDGRGAPFVSGNTFTVNQYAYVAVATGLISSTGTIVVGVVTNVVGAAATLHLTIKSLI